jgi:predicted secreted Zn-dependent protease
VQVYEHEHVVGRHHRPASLGARRSRFTLPGKKWDSYQAALRRHEDGHYAHGLAAEREIEALGRSFHVAGACSTIAKAFNDEAGSIIAKYQALDANYDLETDHGENQGATFP